jgi:hypothetical protein
MGKTRKRVLEKRVRSRVRSQKGGKCCLYEGKNFTKNYSNPAEEEEKECWKLTEDFGPPGLIGARAARKGDVGCVFLAKKTKQCVSWRPELTELLTAAAPIGVWYSNHFWKHFDAVLGMKCYDPGNLQAFVKGFVPNMYIGHERTEFSMELLDLQATAESLAQMPPKYVYLVSGALPDGAKPTHSSANWAAFKTILGLASPKSKLSAIGEDSRIQGVGGYRIVFNPWKGQPSDINGMLFFTLVPLPAQGFGIVAGQSIGGGAAYPRRPHPAAFNDIKFNQLPTHHYNNIQANIKIINAASGAASPQVASGSGVAGGGGGGGGGGGEEQLKRLQATTLMMEQYMEPGIEGFVQQGVLSKHDETLKAYKARNKMLWDSDRDTYKLGLQYLSHWRRIEEAKAVLKQAEEVHREAEATKEMIKWMNAGEPLKMELTAAIASASQVAKELNDACEAADAAATGSATDSAAYAAATAAAKDETPELDSVILKAQDWKQEISLKRIPAEKKAEAKEVLGEVSGLLEAAEKVKECIRADTDSCLESAKCLEIAAQATKVANLKAIIRSERKAAESQRSADALAAGSAAMMVALPTDVPLAPMGAAAEPPPPPDGTKRPVSRTMGAAKKVKKTKTKTGEFNLADSGDDLRTTAQKKAAEKKAAEALKAAGIARAQRGTKKGKKKGGRARTRKRRRTRRKMKKYTRRPRHNRGRITRRR